MLCEICGKNQASVHLTEIIDDKMTELHLCEECAREKGAQMEQHFGLADLLAGLADLGSDLEVGIPTGVKCPNCGITFEDFKRIGRLGCSQCYTTFKKSLAPLLKRIHGSLQHMGKTPGASTLKLTKEVSQLQELRQRLEKAIAQEEFEEAAKLRDHIKKLELKATSEGKTGEGKIKGKGKKEV